MKKIVRYGGVFTVLALMAVQAQAFDGPGERAGQGPWGERGHPEFGQQDEHGGPGGGMARMLDNPEFAKRAGLSEEQVAELKETMYQHRKEMIDLQAATERADLELEHALSAQAPDEAAVMAAVDAVGEARTAMQKARIKLKLNMQSICPIEKMRQKRMGDRGAKYEKGPGKPERKGEFKGRKGKGPQNQMDREDDE